MEFDPLKLADTMRESYAEHYAGSQPKGSIKNLISRYHDGTGVSLENDLAEFIRTKGPYLQVLDLPRMSDTPWKKFTDNHDLHSDIKNTFDEAGFQNLFEFQEEAIEAIQKDNHTLLSAGTGRGKTEGWLIPILQFICDAKAGKYDEHPPESVKCVLTYPTKALAQDQLKRLIDYLFTLNRSRSPESQITVGIYDGDTKNRNPDELAYLKTTFQYFDCPCGNCDSSLTVSQKTDNSFVVEPLEEHEEDLEFDFIDITRDAIVEDPADILLTNPDTINYRLFNTNGNEEQQRFVSEPKYFVFDEIHEYSEVFGSFTASLMRRYIRERQELNEYGNEAEDDLTIIGASATVENKLTVFQRINPFVDPEIEVVEEEERTIDSPFPDHVPDDFLSEELSKSELLEGDTEASESLLNTVGVNPDSTNEVIRNSLYEHLVEDENTDLDFVRGIYSKLRKKPLRPDELRNKIIESVGVTEKEAETVVSNFMTIGEVSNILERRAHLFSWPLDGYYTCINCETVYDTPRSSCDECGHHFVTKLALCNQCGEESLESWFCPNCERLEPHTVTSEKGRFEYFQNRECQCETVNGENPDMVRVYWRPFYECSECEERQKIDHQKNCPSCGSSTTLDNSMESRVCLNPECGRELDVEESEEPTCHSCDEAALEPLTDETIQYCTECGERYESSETQECSTQNCSGNLTPKRLLGWTCGDTSCGEVYFGRPPNTCDCGKRKFIRTALFDIRRVDECQSCGKEFLPGGRQDCGCDDPEVETRAKGYRNFRVIDDSGRIREVSNFRGALPCHHSSRENYSKSDRYDSMLRGPANAAVTTGRYLLRSLAERDNPETFTESKMLSFADSQSDMKELERNFREPEESFFFDQLFIESTRSEANSSGWVTLSDIIDTGVSDAKSYEEDLSGETDNPPEAFDFLTNYDQSADEYLTEELLSRVLPGKYSRRYRSQQITDDGLVDIRLKGDPSKLEPLEKEFLAAVVSQNHRYEPNLTDEFDNGHDHLESLLELGYLRRVEEDGNRYIMVDENKIECAVVDDETPTYYTPSGEEFVTSLEKNLTDISGDVVEFGASPDERSSFHHPHFSLTAQQVTTSDPIMLLSEAYYGETDREERRELEYQFRQGRYPHFLSSGPAMELGVDIGDLNSLLLYGTPPNANSYLQRIGRAGRESGNSLIHSVSQRNPIDYYYHENPEALIASDPQQVPLNEVNREVLHKSLTWGILDWVATTRWIPWRRDPTGIDDYVVCDDDVIKRSEPRPNDILEFNSLLSYSNFHVQNGVEDGPLEVLYSVVIENRDEVEQWLEDIVSFGACSSCGRKHAVGYNGKCERDDCDGSVESVLDEYPNLVEAALAGNGNRQGIKENIIDLYKNQQNDLYEDIDKIDEEKSEVRREKRSADNRERKQELREKKKQLQRRADQLDEYLDRIEDMELGSYLNQESPTSFGLRSVGATVDYRLIGEDFETISNGSRGRRIALSELHPSAGYLHSSANETYVVTEVSWEPLETKRISDQFEDAAICPTCATEYDTGTSHCESCGTRLKKLVTKVPERVTAYKEDLPMGKAPGNSELNPSDVYQTDEDIQGTYAPVETDAGDSFEAIVSYNLVDGDGNVHGRFEYGDVNITASTNKYWATYKNGASDPLPNVFEMCGVEGCNGVIANVDGSSVCTNNFEHSVDDSIAVRPATRFNTKAARIQLDNEELEHGFAHGIRVALQYIGGVSVRQVPESIEDDGTLVYDFDEGGSGITVLLTQENGEKFERAVEKMKDAFSPSESKCDCENGCPFCIYQYGCAEQNDPESFDKEGLLNLLDRDLTIEPR